jgi:Mrp family chromosome partitioning ATPase
MQSEIDEPTTVAAPETFESANGAETQVEATSLVEDTNEAETNVTPPIVAPVVEDEEPDTKEIPPLNSTIANIDKDVAGLEVDTKTEPPVVAKQELKPAWEVDRLLWPNEVDQLYESESEYFRHAGEKLRNASHEGLRVLGVSATHEGEGCTTLAICLARAAAEAGVKVGLMDANLRSPQLATALGLDFARSWHETLHGNIPLAEAAVTAIADNVTLIPLSKSAARQGFTLDDDLINDILCQASEAFDLVLVDLGVLSADGRSCFTGNATCPLDAAIIVRDVRVTSEEETLESVSRFRDLGIDAVGIAENFASTVAVQAAA